MKSFDIAVIPGDGIGPEVMEAAMQVLQLVGTAHGGFRLNYTHFPWGCTHYLAHGEFMPADGLSTLRSFDAIYFGAVGWPTVPDHVSLWGLLIPIRQGFDQYINLRPVRLLPGVPGPLRLRPDQTIDMVFVRENSEGEYSGMGGRFHKGQPDELALQTGVFTRKGIERVVRYSFDLATKRPRHRLCSATKSNALQYSMVLWDEIVAEVARDYPTVTVDKQHVDALAARMLTAPQTLDVVVGSNLFGDILTDIGGALQGSLGIPAGANLNPEGRYPSLFEPVHGSAPDIAGKGIANPIAAVWAGAMMLGHLGFPDAEALLMQSIDRLAAEGKVLTSDLGGTANTLQVADRIAALARELAGR